MRLILEVFWRWERRGVRLILEVGKVWCETDSGGVLEPSLQFTG